ncbi:MAG TPA: substrate-binding domain-containing protein [Pseudonocardiaceae bacterium]|jgi:L-arabinose transport system substrate-binding protein|nr:substrate-binding domain-containing protein [Pseudonocardiaceae bacterium]
MQPLPRRAIVGLALVLSTGVLVACSSGATTSSPNGTQGATKTGALTIAYLQKQGDQQYFVDEANGAKQQAATMGNVKVDVVDLGTDSNQAISDLTTEIGQQVDGIAIVVPDQKIGPQVVGQAASANIPLLSSDDPITDGAGKAAPFVGFDSVQMGTAVGKEAATLYQKAGWNPADTKVLAVYQQGLSDCQQREQGEEAGFAGAAGATLPIVKVGTDNSVVDAQNKTGAVITANPQVKNWVVWGCNDESETGAVTALQNSGLAPADIIGVGLGGYLTCKDWQAGKASGNKAALFIDGRQVGAQSIKVLVDHLRTGAALPAKTIVPTKIVDPSNWKQAGLVCT